MSMQRARSAEEYIEWVKQAMFEVEDLRNCFEFDFDAEEFGVRFPDFLDPLQEGIKALYDAMCEGRYAFGRDDLPFMDLCERHADEIPFQSLLRQINETHRRGLDVDPAD